MADLNQKPTKGRIMVVDSETRLRMEYDDFVLGANVRPSNDFNRDMPTALLKAIPDPIHGYRVYLCFDDGPRYFACYEWDATNSRWALEAAGYEPPLPTLRDAYNTLVTRIHYGIEQIDHHRESNARYYKELEKIAQKLIKEGDGDGDIQAFETMSRSYKTAYFQPQ